MLTPIPTTATGASKFIFVPAVTNATLYTVPSGKTFTGRFLCNGNAEIRVNGVALLTTSSITSYQFPFDFTFPAGTVISCGGSYSTWTLIGSEQ